MIFLIVHAQIIFLIQGKETSTVEKDYCYESIDPSDNEKLIIRYKNFGQPPTHIRMEYSIDDKEDSNYYIDQNKEKFNTSYLRVDKICTSTVEISCIGKKFPINIYFKFYSGNMDGSFYQFRVRVHASAGDKRYPVAGGENYFTALIDLIKTEGFKIPVEPIKRFSIEHVNKVKVARNEIGVCLAGSHGLIFLICFLHDNLKKYFQGLESLEFICEQNEEDKTYLRTQFAAWECNFPTESEYKPQLVYNEDCNAENLKIKIKNIEDKEITTKFHKMISGKENTVKEGSIGIKDMDIDVWEKYEPSKKMNGKNIIYLMKKIQKEGTCTNSGEKKAHKIIIDIEDSGREESNFDAFAWYINQQADSEGDVTLFYNSYIDELYKCNFNQKK